MGMKDTRDEKIVFGMRVGRIKRGKAAMLYERTTRLSTSLVELISSILCGVEMGNFQGVF